MSAAGAPWPADTGGESSRFIIPRLMSERNEVSSTGPSRYQHILIALWLSASAVLLVFAFLEWIETGSRPHVHQIPSPMDRTSGYISDRIRLFRKAAPFVRRGSSFTVRGSNDDDDMAMFMIGLGELPGRKTVPFSYFGHHNPNLSSQTRFVIDTTCLTQLGPTVRLVKKFDEGCLFERMDIRP